MTHFARSKPLPSRFGAKKTHPGSFTAAAKRQAVIPCCAASVPAVRLPLFRPAYVKTFFGVFNYIVYILSHIKTVIKCKISAFFPSVFLSARSAAAPKQQSFFYAFPINFSAFYTKTSALYFTKCRGLSPNTFSVKKHG